MKRKYKFRASLTNRQILGATLEVSDFLRNVCLKLRISTSVDSLVPYVSKNYFLKIFTDVLKILFLSTFFFHSLDYGLFPQATSGCFFWIEFRDWEKNQLCWLVKSLLSSLLVLSPCYRGLEMHYKHMCCM